MERITAIFQNSKWKNAMELLTEYEKDRIYCCHGMEHLLSVARIAWILYLEQDGVDGELQDRASEAETSKDDDLKNETSKELIYAASLLHDIGRVKEYETGMDHHEASAQFARDILFGCGFEEAEIAIIEEAILAHRKDRDATGRIAQCIQRADDLSRLCFMCEAADTCKWTQDRKNQVIIC